MIVAGFSSIVIFQGFTGHLLISMEEFSIRGLYGHYQVARQSHWDNDPELSLADKMTDPKSSTIVSLSEHPEVHYTSGRLAFFALLSTRRSSVSAMGWAFDPQVEVHFSDNLMLSEGEAFSGDPYEVLLGSGLKTRLQVEQGHHLTLVAQTLDGAINALDLQVRGAFTTGTADFDSGTFYLPLQTAQDLLDTERVDRMMIMLNSKRSNSSIETEFQALLEGSEYSKKSWFELNDFYRQVMSYFQLQNRLIEGILMTLMFLAIMSTISMSVFERMGEIGTARALGSRRRDILFQFLLEGLCLGAIGSALAIPVSAWIAWTITAMEFPLVLPGSSITYPIEIAVLPSAFLHATVVALLAALLASVAPAYRAARMQITEALRASL